MALARSISDSGLPLGSTETFYVDDEAMHGWSWWGVAGRQAHTLRWRWLAPDGSVYASMQQEVEHPCSFVAWSSVPIAGTAAAGMPGVWRVELWADGELRGTRDFQIVAAPARGDAAGRTPTPVHQGATGIAGGSLGSAGACLGPLTPGPSPNEWERGADIADGGP